MLTKTEYVRKLAELYYAANLSDSDNPNRPDWMQGDECTVHCQAFDLIVRDMGLSDIWGNLLEGDCFDQIDTQTVTLADMDAWEAFVADNRDAILEQYGSTEKAYRHAVQGGLVLGGGAAPETFVHFAD